MMNAMMPMLFPPFSIAPVVSLHAGD